MSVFFCMEVTHDEDRRRFVLARPGGGGAEAVLQYEMIDEHTVDFQSTFVPIQLRGGNLGTVVVKAALEWARARGLHVVPSCWFVGNVVNRHSEYRDLLAS